MEEAARTTMERLRVEQAGSEYYQAQEKHAEDVARTEARRESDRKKAYEEGKKNYERYLAQEQQKREEEKQHKKEEERAKRQAEQAAAAKEEADKEQQKVKEAQQAKHEDQLQKAEDDILGHSADADAKREQKKDELAKLKEEEERILGIGKKSSFLQGHDDDDEDAEDKEGEENKGKGSKAMTEAEEDAWSRSRLDKLRRLQHRRSQKVSEEDRREGEMKQAEYEAETTMARLKVAQEASEWEQAQRKHEEDVQKTEERKARDNKAKYEEGKRNYEKYLAEEEKKKQDAKVAEKLAQKQKIEEDLKAQEEKRQEDEASERKAAEEAKRQADLKAMEERILGKAEADIDALKNELKNGRAPKEAQDVGHSLVSAFENSFRNFYRGIAKPEDAIEEHAVEEAAA